MRIETVLAIRKVLIETLLALGAHRESALYIETVLALGAHRQSATGLCLAYRSSSTAITPAIDCLQVMLCVYIYMCIYIY